MTKSCSLASFLLWGISTLFFLGCSNSSDYSGQDPKVSAADAVIVFQAGAEEDVTFLHQKHAELWDQACFVCHNHFDVRTDGAWKCAECHSNNDTEGLCADDVNNHDCMAAQCYNCHQDPAMVPGGDPAPNCIDCHIPISTGTFVDGAVQGLRYQTSSQSGLTDASGSFFYLAGGDITFSVGTIVIGSAPVRGFMTPLDLVAGAAGVTDQTVTNIARFLQSLDVDGNPDNGTVLPPDIHTVAQGMTINFAVDKATFELNQNLIALLNNYVFTLVDEADAQAHLQNSIDNQYPPATGTRVSGAPNTQFVLQGAYTATAGVNYTYKWYRDCLVGGVSEISGANSTTYQPTVPSDLGCNISFEVTPDTAGGSASQSGWLGPINNDNPYALYATIGAASEIDQYIFRVSGSTDDDVVIDVQSVESDGAWFDPSHHSLQTPCVGCHDDDGAENLGFLDGGPDNGDSNDKLITNVYLYDTDGTTVKDSKDCWPSACSVSLGDCQPGCDALDVLTRGGRNPYLDIAATGSLSPGDYTVKIGAAPVVFSVDSQGEDINTDGNWYSNSLVEVYPWGGYPHVRSNYKITFTFN